MSDPAKEPVRLTIVTLELAEGLLEAYNSFVSERIYPDRESALLHGLVDSWRHNTGSFHSIRLDLRDERDAENRVSTPAAGTEDIQGTGS